MTTAGVEWDTILQGQAYALRAPASSTPVRLLAQPAYVSTSAVLLPSSHLYDSSAMLGYGTTETHRLAVDSMRLLRVAVHMRAYFDEQTPIDTSEVLALIVLHRRVTALQGTPTDACRCSIFELAADTFRVTKGMYEAEARYARDLTASDRYKDIGFWLNLEGDSAHPGRVPGPDGRLYHALIGSYLPGRQGTAACDARCDTILPLLIAGGHADASAFHDSDSAYESDLKLSIHTTGKVPISIARARISQHPFEVLREGRLDAWLREEIDTLFRDPVLARVRERMPRFAIYDEPHWPVVPANAILAEKMQDFVEARSQGDKRGLFQNPVANFDGYRAAMRDLDTSTIKRVHLLVRQRYNVINGPVPVRYANPDSMAIPSPGWYYAPSQVTVNGVTYPKMIAFNDAGHTEYATYTTRIQSNFGKVYDIDSNTVSIDRPLVPVLARLNAIARTRYRNIVDDTVQVWNVIQTAGWLPEAVDPNVHPGGYTGIWTDDLRPVTGPEIQAQVWLSIVAGVQGIIFQEPLWDGANLGFVDWRAGTERFRSGGSGGEYDTASGNHPKFCDSAGPMPRWVLPKMWLGMRTRYEAVRRVVAEMRAIESVYMKLEHRAEQISMHDLRQTLDSIPMVALLRAERAVDSHVTLTASSATGKYDAPEETYIELSHLRPGPRLAGEAARGVRYLAVCNRRSWPRDFQAYEPWDWSPPRDSAERSGFGNIDVRRPVLLLKNSTPLAADSFLVEKVGHEDSLFWQVNVRDTLRLDWLEPGSGGLYRVTPIASRVSWHGTAFNNAVRSENPSSDQTRRDRIVVYERDSIVYLRTVDSVGTWSREHAVSDAGDRSDIPPAGWQRAAANVNPAVAVMRDGERVLVAWERRDSSGSLTSVEGRLLASLPRADTVGLPASVRLRIGQQRSPLPDGEPLAPAVTGVDGGFVVAWAGGATGVSALALRCRSGALGVTASDTHSVHGIRRVVPGGGDSVWFATIAYAGKDADADALGWTRHTPPGDSVAAGLPPKVVHLAFQQGARTSMTSGQIYYTMLGVRFRDGAAPVLWVAPTELVSAIGHDCSYVHPSIAADRAHVGIAFVGRYRERIILRWRDTVSPSVAVPVWRSQAYAWNPNAASWYDWPSLTHFPGADSANLVGNAEAHGPEGFLVWTRPDAPAMRSEQFIFRYGWGAPERLADGMYPTLTLASRSADRFTEHSSVLYRGDSTRVDTATRPGGTLGRYLPLLLDNGPLTPSAYFFSSGHQNRVMFSTGIVRRFNDPACPLGTTTDFGIVTKAPRPAPPDTIIADTPGIAPSFYLYGSGRTPPIVTADEITGVTRTGLFRRSAEPVTITRFVNRGTGVKAWLETEPYDTIDGTPHDIRILTELVRTDDEVVLWRDDTISVVAMSSDSLVDDVLVPSNQAAPGTIMYVRVRAVPSDSLAYEAAAVFEWQAQAPSWMLARRMRPIASPSVVRSSQRPLGLTVSPNPARRSATVTIAAHDREIRLTLHDALGRPLRGMTAAVGAGSVELDLTGLPAGLYLLRGDDGILGETIGLSIAE